MFEWVNLDSSQSKDQVLPGEIRYSIAIAREVSCSPVPAQQSNYCRSKLDENKETSYLRKSSKLAGKKSQAGPEEKWLKAEIQPTIGVRPAAQGAGYDWGGGLRHEIACTLRSDAAWLGRSLSRWRLAAVGVYQIGNLRTIHHGAKRLDAGSIIFSLHFSFFDVCSKLA